MEPTQAKVPTGPTQVSEGGVTNLASQVAKVVVMPRGDELWTRAFLLVFCALSGLIAAILAYFYFQRPEALASSKLEDALLGTDHASMALCLYHDKALQYNVRLLVALRFLGIFVGAQCILLGALFLLKGIETSYQFHLTSDRASSSINTSSPGLVLITLGVLLVALPQFHDQELVAGAMPSCGQSSAAAVTPSTPAAAISVVDGGAADLAVAPPAAGGAHALVTGEGSAAERRVKHVHRRKSKRP